MLNIGVYTLLIGTIVNTYICIKSYIKIFVNSRNN